MNFSFFRNVSEQCNTSVLSTCLDVVDATADAPALQLRSTPTESAVRVPERVRMRNGHKQVHDVHTVLVLNISLEFISCSPVE